MTHENQGGVLCLQPVGAPPEGGPPIAPVTTHGEPPVVIGRGRECQVCIPDPSVSRDHASVTRRGKQWFVTDLGSRHGTMLNGVRLQADHPAVAAPGDLVRIGPYTFRVEIDGQFTSGESSEIAMIDDTPEAGTMVERVPSNELGSLAQRRLDLLIEGAVEIHQATDEAGLADAILELALAGSGYQRAAVLSHAGTQDEVEIVSSRDQRGDRTQFPFSRSLLAEAASGHVARLCRDAPRALGHSITSLHIHSVLCAPIVIDSAVVGFLYLDSRESEEPGFLDASGFCHAVARLAGLALSSLRRAELERRQLSLDRDLQAARKAQAFLLPPDEGDVGHLHYAMRTHPGRVVAGDLFDIWELDDHRVAVCCGDVTGQGMGAALVMTAVLSHLRASMARTGKPSVAISDVNRFIASRTADDMFASLWVGVFDRADHMLIYVDAGHGHWAVRKAGAAPEPPTQPGGLLIGIEPDHSYVDRTITVGEGDRVILYSDGLVEHRSAAGDEFGRDRLLSAITASDAPPADVENALAALRVFIDERDLDDDVTMASIEVRA